MSAVESESEDENQSEKSTYDVEKIIARRTRKGKIEYKIKWENFPMSQCTWEPMENLENVKYLVDEYNNEHPPKSKKNSFINKKRKNSDKDKESSENSEKSVKKTEKNIKKNEKNGKNVENDTKKNENYSKKSEKNSKKNENYSKKNENNLKKDENSSKKLEISSKKTESSSKKDENGSKSSSKKSQNISSNSSKKSNHISKTSSFKNKQSIPNNLKKNSKSSSKFSSFDDTPLGSEYKKNTFIVDERLKKVITVQIRQGRLVAVVDKIDSDETFRNNIPTEELRKLNPWILLDFYESKIKFN